jgi:hypothetical protein
MAEITWKIIKADGIGSLPSLDEPFADGLYLYISGDLADEAYKRGLNKKFQIQFDGTLGDGEWAVSDE